MYLQHSVSRVVGTGDVDCHNGTALVQDIVCELAFVGKRPAETGIVTDVETRHLVCQLGTHVTWS